MMPCEPLSVGGSSATVEHWSLMECSTDPGRCSEMCHWRGDGADQKGLSVPTSLSGALVLYWSGVVGQGSLGRSGSLGFFAEQAGTRGLHSEHSWMSWQGAEVSGQSVTGLTAGGFRP